MEICGPGCTGTRPGPPGVFLPVLSVGRDRTAVGCMVGLDGCEVRLCVIRVPVCPVCVPAPPGVFLPVLVGSCTQAHRVVYV